MLRKIRECGSSVTYYGGRIVQNTTAKLLQQCGNVPAQCNKSNGQTIGQRNSKSVGCGHSSTIARQPNMMTQTHTRARVREIETCCNNCQQVNDSVAADKEVTMPKNKVAEQFPCNKELNSMENNLKSSNEDACIDNDEQGGIKNISAETACRKDAVGVGK